MSTKEQLQERKDAQEQLRRMLKHGQDVYTLIRYTSKSGLTNHISVFIVDSTGIREITYLVAKALGEKIAPKGGIRTNSAELTLVRSLQYALWEAGMASLHHRWL